MKKWLVIGGAVVLPVAILYHVGWLLTVITWMFGISVAVLGFILGVATKINTGTQYKPPPKPKQQSAANMLFTKMMEMRSTRSPEAKKVVVSPNLDVAIQELLDLVSRDYIMSWYTELCKDHEYFQQVSQSDMWYMVEKLSERLGQIDLVRFMTQDAANALCRHYQDIRHAATESKSEETQAMFLLHPWLSSEDRELEFLRKVAEVFIIYLAPKPYAECKLVRHLLREILACAVMKTMVDVLCDPDYINQTLFNWLLYREQLALAHKRTYTYAATYEDFIKMINQSMDVEPLKQIRYNIITEIMQAATINNLKRERGIDPGKESAPKGTTKGDLLRARNLKRYMNQLTIAKSHCEKRIHLLGGPDYKSYTQSSEKDKQANMPGRKVLSFRVIIETAKARKYFRKYLKRDDNDSLLGFWMAVESLKHSDKRHWHQLASEIYQMYVASSSSVVRFHVDRAVIKGMEAFMLGDTGPEKFYDAQEQVYRVLEDHHYPSFIVSDIYHSYITQVEDEQDMTDVGAEDELKVQVASPRPRNSSFGDEHKTYGKIFKHSSYAQQKLQKLDNKIMNKSQALQALKQSQKSDARLAKLAEDIEKEIEMLKADRRQLEFHIDRTEVWSENLGHWKAHIYNSEEVQEEDRMVLYFVIVVHPSGMSQQQPPHTNTQGWVISRTLEDFHTLHDKLAEICPSLKKKALPKQPRLKSKSAEFTERAKKALEVFLAIILQDDQLAHSEAVFAFFSPSPEHLKQAGAAVKKNKFSFTNFLKNLPTRGQDSDSEDELLFLDETDPKEHSKDSVAAALYKLIAELCEIRGVFKWLRRTLMVFVKVTFGKTINRQLRETVEWIFSEPMLIYYIHLFRDSYWPNGQLAPVAPARSDEDKLKTRKMAKEAFLQNLPDAAKNLVGEQNARRGAIKMFEAMQDVRLNKHLFYVLLELLLCEVFPEIKEFQDPLLLESTLNKTSSSSDVRVHVPPIMILPMA